MLPSISWLFRATSDVTGAIWYTSTDIISTGESRADALGTGVQVHVG